MIVGKNILIFGGSGSLGNQIIRRYLGDNTITNYSRDECKHWKMKMTYHSDPKLKFVIGDIRDKIRVKNAIRLVQPNIIIIASAMKHIDQCEFATHECLQTNLIGIKNVLDSIDEETFEFKNFLETVCFISTDKACSPVNVYGMAKAISESLVVEKSMYNKNFKFVSVRYGNVLNSRGSIIPILHDMGKDPLIEKFKLTHIDMTRFVMTLDESVDLIQHAIIYGESGDIVIPKLISMKVKDLIEIFCDIYNKTYVVTGLRPGEKMLESLINDTQSMRTTQDEYGYTFIKPTYINKILNDEPKDFNSTINPLNKEELKDYLLKLNLI